MKNQSKPTCPNRELLEKLIANKISEVRSKIVELKSENKEFSDFICTFAMSCYDLCLF